jgi:putative redox protein
MTDTANNAPLAGEIAVLEETGDGKFQIRATVGGASFLVDEPAQVGGMGSGPNPYDLLSAALGSCTAMTIRLYADRKAWSLTNVRVRVAHDRSGPKGRDVFNREVSLEGELDDMQRARLKEIAERCPVHLTLTRGADVTTKLIAPNEAFDNSAKSRCEHMKAMEEACA